MISINNESDIAVRKCTNGQYIIKLKDNDQYLDVNISAQALHSFLVSGIDYVASNLEASPEQLSLLRAPGHALNKIDDYSMQSLLREVDTALFMDFLWFMDDAELVEKVAINCSMTAEECLRSDLNILKSNYPGKPIGLMFKRGRTAVKVVSEVLNKVLKSFED